MAYLGDGLGEPVALGVEVDRLLDQGQVDRPDQLLAVLQQQPLPVQDQEPGGGRAAGESVRWGRWWILLRLGV